MKILVQKFGGTSVATPEARNLASGKVARAVQAGWRVVVVVSAIGRAGEPYATDTLISTLKAVDPAVPPAPREMDLMMACGEIISTVVMAQTLRARGFDTVALTGGQAGIITDYDFGNARIQAIDPAYMARMLAENRIVLVAGFQGTTERGAITTLGRGGSDTTASALGAALKPHADEIAVEIYTDVDGVKTADPRLAPNARTLPCLTYQEIAEMAHLGAKVVHPRAVEIAHQYEIPLWVKSTFSDGPGALITTSDCIAADARLHGLFSQIAQRVTGVTHTGKIAYLRFTLPTGCETDKGEIELAIYRMLQDEGISLYLNSTGGGASFAFAVARADLPRLRELLDGLVVPIRLGVKGKKRGAAKEGRAFGRAYLLGTGLRKANFKAQRAMLEEAASLIDVHTIEAEVQENCTMVSVIASQFTGIPGVLARLLAALALAHVPVYQISDSEFSISALIPEADQQTAVRALHDAFALAEG